MSDEAKHLGTRFSEKSEATMATPNDVIEINGPSVDIHQPDWVLESNYSSQVIYSVRLTNGRVVTSPEMFNSATEGQSQPHEE